MMTDDVYRDLWKKAPKINISAPSKGQGPGQQGQGQSGAGKGGGPDPNGKGGQKGFDMHIHEMTPSSDQDIKRAIATAKEAAKAMGKMPAALERLVDEYLKPKVSWKEKLRHHVTRCISREASTWATPHRRRLVTTGIYYPSYTGFGAGLTIVAFDTSGSIGQTELDMFMAELNDILQTTRPEKVILLSCDAQVYTDAIHYLDDGEDIMSHPPKIRGGGGTCFRPVFEWFDNEGLVPAAVVYLTDLMGTFPSTEPKYPTIWCSTVENAQAPFGETIFIDRTEK
jgi:predicted metal-dependent peptidase